MLQPLCAEVDRFQDKVGDLETAANSLLELIPDESAGVNAVKSQVADTKEKYDRLTTSAHERETNLKDGLASAEQFQDDHGRLATWIGDAEKQIAALGKVPAKPEVIEKKTEQVQVRRIEKGGGPPSHE